MANVLHKILLEFDSVLIPYCSQTLKNFGKLLHNIRLTRDVYVPTVRQLLIEGPINWSLTLALHTPSATPYSLYVPRNVPIPLQPKVKEELVCMERIGVTSNVTEPTPWCAGMVIVPKKYGEVRVCVNLKPLNENVLREPYPIPKVDEMLGATHYSKLVASGRFLCRKNLAH